MKKIVCLTVLAVSALLVQGTASAQSLLVTEINSNAAGGDFFEITNFGTTTINLYSGGTPASWDDNSYQPGSVLLPLGASIAPNESIIFLADSSDTETFRALWNLSASVQIFGDSTGTGLGGNDAVTLYSPTGSVLATLSYAAGGFTRSNGTLSLGGHSGVSAGGATSQTLIWDPTSGTTAATARYTFANGSSFGTFANGSGAVGSPGAIPEPSTYALIGLGLAAVLMWARRRPAVSAR